MRNPEKTLIVLVGPTASGKTDIAISLARHFNTEVISADSRQFYKEIPIGTAAPSKDQLKKVKHHFIGHLSVEQKYNVSRFERDVLDLLAELFKTKDRVIMTGGSGLYINAVCKGIDELPDPDPQIRSGLDKLFEDEGIVALQEKLKMLDPEYFEIVDRNNPKRLMRAIEICLQTGTTYTALRQNQPKKRDFRIIKVGLEVERSILAERINERASEMLESGWIEEARSVHHLKHFNSLNTVGYKELYEYFDGNWDFDTAIEKIKTNTRRYAKRQMTWFRKDSDITWFKPEEVGEVIGYLEKRLGLKT